MSDYLEGAMTPEQMTRFEHHLKLCDGCVSFVEQVRTTAAMAGRLSADQIPAEMKGKLLTAFRDWGQRLSAYQLATPFR